MDDDDLEGLEEETPQPAGFAGLPEETQKEIKKLRKENQNLRSERGTLQKEVLTAKYRADVVELIPEEVTAFDRQVAVAEQIKAKLAAGSTQSQPEEAPGEASEEKPVPEGLKAVGDMPPATTSSPPGSDLSAKEIGELHTKDPGAFMRELEAKYGGAV